MLNKKMTNSKEKPEGVSDSEKMPDGGIETEFIPLSVFLDDMWNGQTYALELTFALEQGLFVSDNFDFYQKLARTLLNNFLSDDLSKLTGYAVTQANIYGLKTERYANIMNILDLLNSYPDKTITLKDSNVIGHLLSLNLAEYTTIDVSSSTGTTAPAIRILKNKVFPLTVKLDTIIKSFDATQNKYGARVKSQSQSKTDFKAISHAVRIIEQIIELSETGNITFPRPNADYLRDIKLGLIDNDIVHNYMTEQYSYMENKMDKSILPSKTPEREFEFKKFKLNTLLSLYSDEIKRIYSFT